MALLAILYALQAVAPAATAPDDVVVRAVVPPHCHPRSGDPLDAVRNLPDQWMLMHPQPDGSIKLVEDKAWQSGPTYWQRSGANMGNFVFRVPDDDNPLCVGSRTVETTGGVQLRRVLDPKSYRGKLVRFTAFAASRDAQHVSFWINGGGGQQNFVQVVWHGTHGWTPVSIETRVSDSFPMLMYGFTLSGGGDIWLYKVRLDTIGHDGKAVSGQ